MAHRNELVGIGGIGGIGIRVCIVCIVHKLYIVRVWVGRGRDNHRGRRRTVGINTAGHGAGHCTTGICNGTRASTCMERGGGTKKIIGVLSGRSITLTTSTTASARRHTAMAALVTATLTATFHLRIGWNVIFIKFSPSTYFFNFVQPVHGDGVDVPVHGRFDFLQVADVLSTQQQGGVVKFQLRQICPPELYNSLFYVCSVLQRNTGHGQRLTPQRRYLMVVDGGQGHAVAFVRCQ